MGEGKNIMVYDQNQQAIKKWNEEKDLDRWEKHYYEDNYNGNRLRRREEKVLEYLDSLKLPKEANVLELGYGAGMTSAKIYARGHNLVGIDISNKLRDIAIRNCQQALADNTKGSYRFIIGNAEKLDFPDNHFDCVVGLGFLQYLQFPEACFREVKRVLKPGGHFILAQRNMYGISSIDGPLKWMRSLFYLTTGRRYELRWQDTPLFQIPYLFSAVLSPVSAKAKKFKESLQQHKQIGLVRKNALSFGRLKKLFEQEQLNVVRYDGAGYLTKKRAWFPSLAKKIDVSLQSASDDKKLPGIHRFGNSVVFLAQKR